MPVSVKTKLRLSIVGAALSLFGFVFSLIDIREHGIGTPSTIGICATVIALVFTIISIVRSVRKPG